MEAYFVSMGWGWGWELFNSLVEEESAFTHVIGSLFMKAPVANRRRQRRNGVVFRDLEAQNRLPATVF